MTYAEMLLLSRKTGYCIQNEYDKSKGIRTTQQVKMSLQCKNLNKLSGNANFIDQNSCYISCQHQYHQLCNKIVIIEKFSTLLVI